MGPVPRACVVLVTLAAALLVGCSSGSTDSLARPSTVDAPSSRGIDSGGTPTPGEGRSTATATATAGADTAGADTSGADTSGTARRDRAGSATGVDPSPAAEVPVVAEAPVESLSDLLDEINTAPLVTAPLPRSASARGRLVQAYPGLLRPAPGSEVESSSISPSGDRLQVALVASTSLAPAEVLLAYRSRLARRGLVEQPTPITTPGSEAAAFRRGRSVITVTVTALGSATGYAVSASLHTGGT